jgi:hypothetical protein
MSNSNVEHQPQMFNAHFFSLQNQIKFTIFLEAHNFQKFLVLELLINQKQIYL